MSEIHLARIAAVIPPGDRHGAWFAEALEHHGLHVERFTKIPERKLAEIDVLLLCGKGMAYDPDLLEIWLNSGRQQPHQRALVVCGTTWGLEQLLGVEVDSDRPWAQTGTILPTESELWPAEAGPIRFFGGVRVSTRLAESHLRTSEGDPAVTCRNRAWLLTAHLGQSLAYHLLGSAVETDGVGPEDGSAKWDQGPPRAEYGARSRFEEREEGAFLQPHADALRELWIRIVLEAVRETGKRALMLWHLPRNLNHAATLSLDCDTAVNSDLFNLNASLLMTGARATMLVRHGGFGPDVFGWMRRVGHEIAFALETDEPGGWHPARVKVQIAGQTRLAAVGPITSLRVAQGAWNGWLQPYESFAEAGIRNVISKGGTERGSAGFLFGTCHPFFPIKDNKPIGPLEHPYQIYDVGVATTDAMVDPILSMVKKRHGVLHGVTRVSMIHNEAGIAGIMRWLSVVKQSGADFFTTERLGNFERARRQTRLSVVGQSSVHLGSDENLEGLTLMVQGSGVEGSGLIGRTAPQYVRRFGQDFIAFTVNLEKARPGVLRLFEDRAA